MWSYWPDLKPEALVSQKSESDALQLKNSKTFWSSGPDRFNALTLKSWSRTVQILDQPSPLVRLLVAFQLEKSFLKRLEVYRLGHSRFKSWTTKRNDWAQRMCVHPCMYAYTHTYLVWRATVSKLRIFQTESAKKWLTGASSITSLASNLFSHFWGDRVHWDDSKAAEEFHVLAPSYCWQNSSRQRHVRGMDPDH